MKIYKYLTLSVIFIMTLTSCKKEIEGNYNASKINDITVDSTFQDKYLMNQGDTLRLDAKVSQTQNNGNLSYRWYYYYAEKNLTGNKYTEVGNSQHLALPLTMPTGVYTITLETTDNNSGIKAYRKITLDLRKYTSEGWVLLTNENSKPNITVVAPDGNIYKNLMLSSPVYPLTGTPLSLTVGNSWDLKVQPIVLKTSNNMYFLNFDDFSFEKTAGESVNPASAELFTKFEADAYFNSYYMIDAAGVAYWTRKVDAAKLPTEFQVLGTKDAKGYIAAPLSIPVQNGGKINNVFFDIKNHRFLYILASNPVMSPFMATPASAQVDLNNFTPEILNASVGANLITYIFAKRQDGAIVAYTAAFDDFASNKYPGREAYVLDIPVGQTPSLFTPSGKLPLFYYILGKSLYVYKVGENKSTLLYTFSADETMVDMKMIREPIIPSSDPDPLVNNRIVIATNKGTEGNLYTFDLDPTGAIKAGRYSNLYTGLGTIVSIAYKEKR